MANRASAALAGAIMQIVSVWLGGHIARKPLVVGTALLQSAIVAGMAAVALPCRQLFPLRPSHAAYWPLHCLFHLHKHCAAALARMDGRPRS